MAVSSQYENFGNLDGDTDKNLLLDFSKVSRYRLKNLLVFALLTDHRLAIVVQVPVFQVLVTTSNEVILIWRNSNYCCWLGELISTDLLPFFPIPYEQTPIIGISK